MKFIVYFAVFSLINFITTCLCLQNLTLLCMIPWYRRFELGTSCAIAANMAVEAINQNTTVLPDYRLELELADSQMSQGVAAKAFFDSISRSPTKIGVIGPLISTANAYVASISKFYNLVQMGYAASGLSLDDKKNYPYYYRTSITQYSYSLARIKLLKQFKWEKVAIIYSTAGTYSTSAAMVQQTLLEANINVAVMESFDDHPSVAIKAIKDKDVRIIVVISHYNQQFSLFCEAYKQGTYGGQYVWLVAGWHPDKWWTRKWHYSNCTADELEKVVVNSTFYTKAPIYSTASRQTIYGKNGTQFYRDFLKKINSNNTVCTVAGQLYDAVWSLALALNSTEGRLKQLNLSLQKFNYQHNQIREILMEELNKISFYGTTGPIEFHKGSRIGDVEIYQQQGNGVPLVFVYRHDEKKLEFEKPLIWKYGYPPRDHVAVKINILTISKSLFIPFSVCACLGICLALAIAAFVIYFRNNKFIKMSSPNLNYSILAGCILCYISSIFLGLDSNFVPKSALRHMCTIQIWLLSLGFTIAFGSVTVKSWRIYKIFFNPTKIRMVIRDIQLFGRLIQLLAVDIVILSLWTTIDPITIMENNIGSPKRIVTANIETIVMHRIQICYSKYTSVWLAVTLSYKLLLLLVGVFLAWKTRKVSIDSLNDSHSLAMTVYNIFVLSCTGIIVGIASNLILDAQFAMQASFVILCTTSSMGLLFIPKISQVKIHPIQVTSSSKLDKQVRESFQKSTLSQKNLELELRKLKLIISEQHQRMQLMEKSDQNSTQIKVAEI